MRRACCAAILAGGVIGLSSNEAHAQYLGGLTLKSTNVVSPQKPETTIEVWAWFEAIPGQAEFFGRAWFDLHADDGVFLSIDSPFPNPWGINWGYNPPVFAGSSILNVDIINSGFLPVPDNPILIGTALWTTTDFRPRSVYVMTEMIEFATYFGVNPPFGLGVYNFKPSEAQDGQTTIQVIPAPPSVALLGLGLGVRRRRRT